MHREVWARWNGVACTYSHHVHSLDRRLHLLGRRLLPRPHLHHHGSIPPSSTRDHSHENGKEPSRTHTTPIGSSSVWDAPSTLARRKPLPYSHTGIHVPAAGWIFHDRCFPLGSNPSLAPTRTGVSPGSTPVHRSKHLLDRAQHSPRICTSPHGACGGVEHGFSLAVSFHPHLAADIYPARALPVTSSGSPHDTEESTSVRWGESRYFS